MVFLLMVLSCLGQKDDMPVAVAKYFEESERIRTESIEHLEVQIKEKTARISKQKNVSAKNKRAQGQELGAMRRALDDLKKGDTMPVPAILPFSIKAGDVGVIKLGGGYSSMSFDSPLGSSRVVTMPGRSNTELRIVQVTGPKDMLIEPFYSVDRSVLDTVGDPFWVTGVDTKNFADNKSIKLDGVFYVSGTKSYRSASGQRTVFLLELVDMEPWLKSRADKKPRGAN